MDYGLWTWGLKYKVSGDWTFLEIKLSMRFNFLQISIIILVWTFHQFFQYEPTSSRPLPPSPSHLPLSMKSKFKVWNRMFYSIMYIKYGWGNSYKVGGGSVVTKGPSTPDWECSRKIMAYSFIKTSSVNSCLTLCRGHTQSMPCFTCAPITSMSVCNGRVQPHFKSTNEFVLISKTITSSFSKTLLMILEAITSSLKRWVSSRGLNFLVQTISAMYIYYELWWLTFEGYHWSMKFKMTLVWLTRMKSEVWALNFFKSYKCESWTFQTTEFEVWTFFKSYKCEPWTFSCSLIGWWRFSCSLIGWWKISLFEKVYKVEKKVQTSSSEFFEKEQ